MRREGAPLRLDDQILAVDQRPVEIENHELQFGVLQWRRDNGARTLFDRARAYASVASGRGSSHHGGAEIR